MIGKDPLSIENSMPLEETKPPVGKVWILSRDHGPTAEEHNRIDFFAGYHSQRIVFTNLVSHAKAFTDVRILASYARYITRGLGTPQTFMVFVRDATPSELREDMPHWRQHRESSADQAAANFAQAVRRMRLGYASA